VKALTYAADCVIPSKRVNFFKYWWDEEAEALKKASINSHKIWKNNGRPRDGPLYEMKTKDKYAYKNYLCGKKRAEHNNVSNALHDALITKNQITFWKMWNNKFKSKNKTSNIIEGLSEDIEIADNFAKGFSKANKLSDNSKKLEKEFLERLQSYMGNCFCISDINLELIDSIINKLERGKSPGVDRLTAEHLQNCHPIVTLTITRLFISMLSLHYVPDAFGLGLTIPIPKCDSKRVYDKIEDYRGITISPVISKIFELCLARCLQVYLNSSNRQFGFKKGSGCSAAIFTLRKVVDHFTLNNSTINLCSLDLSKAFDNLSHNMLFIKLMDRNVPCTIIKLLHCWYSKVYNVVRWGNCTSVLFKLSSGVRQGGILSPAFFAIYVNDVLVKLEKSKLGCHIKIQCYNSLMYADDLILLSVSVSHLLQLIKICRIEFSLIDLNINLNKSGCMRIGDRHNAKVDSLLFDDYKLNWKSEIKYLGILILSARKFTINYQNVKQRYYRSLNGIFGKIGSHSSPVVLCSLINSYCIPILLYALETLRLSNKLLKSFENAYNQAFFKIFSTYDKNVVSHCQFYMGYLPIRLILDIRKLTF
jgi:hypothetical protein